MLNIKRKISQIVFLFILGEFSFYGIFRCPFAVPYTECGSCPVIQCPGKKLWLSFWIILPISLLLFGRGFCSWACPGGLFSDLLSKVSLFKGKIKGKADKILSSIRYLVLLASITFIFLLNNPRWAIPIRTGEFYNSIKLTFEHANTFWLIRTVCIIIGFSLVLIIPHFWCRYLCPTGGLLEALKKISIFKYITTDQCNQCDKCRKVCSVETRPGEINCTNCGDCSNSCTVNAITLKKRY